MSDSTALAIAARPGNSDQVSPRKRFQAGEMDRLMRLFFLLKSAGKTTAQTPMVAATPPENIVNEESSYIEDLTYVHMVSASRFVTEEDNRGSFDAMKILNQIADHPALQPLEEVARYAAATYVFEGLLGQQLRTTSRYWVLEGSDPSYSQPLGIRTGSLPRWQRPSRALKGLLSNLESINREVEKVQSQNIVAAHFDETPFGLLLQAEELVEAAVNWMDAFPKPVSLRSKYREHLRPVLPGEHVATMAYALNRLFHHKVGDAVLLEKDIECRIAALETEFLGQNIEANSEVGCPAVRLQIRTIKRSPRAAKLDKLIEWGTKRIRKQMAERVRNSADAKGSAQLQLLRRLARHRETCTALRDAISAKIDETLRDKVAGTDFRDEICAALKESVEKSNRYLSRWETWSDEFERYWDGIESHLDDIYEHSKVVQKWMRGWEALWALPI